MAGVRVCGIPTKAQEKHLKIHFSKPQNGGGTIKKIYYPLLKNDAVIIFDDPEVVDSLLQNDYACMLGRGIPITIHRLPEHKVFSSMQARVNPDASVLLQASPTLLDEFKYNEEIGVDFDERTGTYVLSGNWYQLEWAWTYLDIFLQQQEVIQDEIKHQPFRNNASPLDVEDGGGGDIGSFHASDRSTEQLGVTESKKSAFYTETVESQRKTGSRTTVAQSLTQSSRRLEETNRKEAAAPDRYQLQPQQKSTEHYRRSPASSDNEDEGDDLRGQVYKIPNDSIPVSMKAGGLNRRADQDNTFGEFSGLHIEADRTKGCGSKNKADTEQHQRPGMDRSDKSTDNHDRHDVWLSDRKSMSMRQMPSMTRSFDKYESGTRLQTGSQDTKSDSKVQTDGGRAPGAQEMLSQTKADKTDVHSSNPDRTDDIIRRKPPSAGYHSLPIQGHVRDIRSSTTEQSSGRLGGADSSRDSPRVPFGETYTKDHTQFRFTVGSVDVLVLYGDLVQETTDAIVNPANSGLEHWGGASYAIARAAGPELDKECRDYIAKNGHLNVSDVMHTTGGKLHAFKVLHTYGPMWFEGKRQEKTEYELTNTFLNCFNYADKHFLKSLCVPAISTGVFGVPLDVCVRSFLDALLIFDNQRTSTNLKNIHFINKDTDATVTAIVLLRTALEDDIRVLTSLALEKFNRFKAKELDLPRGRRERTASYGLGTDSRTSFSSSLYHSSTVGLPTEAGTKTPPRRSSSLSRINHKSPSEAGKDDIGMILQKTVAGASSVTGETKPKSVDTETDSLYSLSKYSSTVDKPKSEKDVAMRTTPAIKASLLKTSGKTDYKLKGIKKPGGIDSPTGKVRTRRVLDDDTTEESDPDTSGLSRVSPKPSTERHRDEYGLHSLPTHLGNLSSATKSSKSCEEKCLICLDTCKKPKTLEQCKHVFCTRCIDDYFKKSKPSCPICGTIYGKVRGTQPRNGVMIHSVKHNVFLPGYEKSEGTIVIKYTFPSGTQERYHPNPGRPYTGVQRTAYLPNNQEGKMVLGLLKKAFEARLVFTIGDSRTTGKEGVLTWNDIHHKTNIYGGPENFGYPDATYLTRVKQELAAKGITSP